MFSGKYSLENRGPVGQNIWDELERYDLIFHNPNWKGRTLQYKWEFERFLEILKEHFCSSSFLNILEIGSYEGGTLYEFMERLRPINKIMAISDDITELTQERLFESAVMFDVEMAIHGVNSHSEHAKLMAELFFLNELDFLFIDGDHTYEGAKQDFLDYGPMVQKGGIIALHDIIWAERHPEVEVNRLWIEIKQAGYITQELYTDPKQGGLGIGLVYV